MTVESSLLRPREAYGELCLDPDSSHQAVLRAVGSAKRVLDVGCGGGFLAAAVKAKGNTCLGIEKDLRRADEARGRGIDVVSWDLNDGLPPLSGSAFDLIIFADVLEHLVDPLPVLCASRSLLAKGGRVIVSVPNVANFNVRAMLLKGKWVYEDEGIMDRTHLRWFTKDSALGLIAQAGLEAEQVQVVPDFPYIRLLAGLHGRVPRLVRRLARVATNLLPGLFGFQFIILARPRVETPVADSTVAPAVGRP